MMTIHVLHAGDGYTYLTREVASADELRANGEAIGDYYTASGNPAGVWFGSGLEDLGVEGVVSEEQMRALFGERLHPNADAIQAKMIAEGASPEAIAAATQLGQKFKSFTNAPDDFDARVKSAFTVFERQHGRRPEHGVEADLVRHNVATKYLTRTAGGEPPTEAQIRTFFAARGAKQRQPVAGLDLVFTPVKSVSVVWGLGDRDLSRVVKGVHDRAVRETFTWLEGHAALTRMGNGGIRQVRANGLTAAMFDHFDSRAGDPNLHTHAAVAGVVMAPDGKWRALDARTLHSFAVAGSERYNLLMEKYLSEALPSVRFENRTVRKGAQPIREIVGVDREVTQLFSKRGKEIRARLATAVAAYEDRIGVAPRKSTHAKLAQEATLQTRGPKPAHMPLAQQMRDWSRELSTQFGSRSPVLRLLGSLNHEATLAAAAAPTAMLTAPQLDAIAAHVVVALEGHHSRWHGAHVHAEASRALRGLLDEGAEGAALRAGIPALANAPRLRDLAAVDATVDDVAATALGRYCVCLESPEGLERISLATRLDGPGRDNPSSAYRVAGKGWFTSPGVLAKEERLIHAGGTVAGPTFDRADVVAVAASLKLTESQAAVATRFAESGRLLDAAIGPAGSGKTTAMRAFVHGVQINRGRVIALATQAVAAEVLGTEIGITAETIRKFRVLHEEGYITNSSALRVDANTLILVDEAGMSSTTDLDAIVRIAAQHGAGVRLIGDPEQIGSVEGGGALRLFDRVHGAEHLTELHRFVDPDEAAATLLIRDGKPEGAQFYIDNGRVFGGHRDDLLSRMYANWHAETLAGNYSVMGAWSNNDVLELNLQAQHDRIVEGIVRPTNRTLHDSSTVGVGDRVVTREPDRKSKFGRAHYVKNGDEWTVTGVKRNGDLSVRHDATGDAHTLQAKYVDKYVELAYARTLHREEGITADVGHLLVTPDLSRRLLYVGLSRGTTQNFLYVETHDLVDVEGHSPIPESDSAAAVLRKVIKTQDEDKSAHETLWDDDAAGRSLRTILPQYEDQITHSLPKPDVTRAADLLERAFGADAHYLDGDRHLRAIDRRLTRLQASGIDPVATLRDRIDVHELARDIAPGALILERLGTPGPGARTGVEADDASFAVQELHIRARLIHPDVVDEVPRGMDLEQLRRAWGVRLSDYSPPNETVLDLPLEEALVEYEAALVGRGQDLAVDSEHTLAVLVDAYGPAAARLPDDTAHWPALVTRVGALERAGVDVPTIARMRVVPATLAEAPEPAAHVLERIGEPGPSVTPVDPDGYVAALGRTVRARLAAPDATAPAGRDIDALRKAWDVTPEPALATDTDAPVADQNTTAARERTSGPNLGGATAIGSAAKRIWAGTDDFLGRDDPRPPRL